MSSSILSDLDWDDGVAMPVANAENKQLEAEVCNLLFLLQPGGI